MPEASAMLETKEVIATQVAYEPPEELEEERFYEISTPSGLANGVGDQAPNFDKEITVGETQAEKKARPARELEDLAKGEEGTRKEEEELTKAEEVLKKEEREVKDLECQLKAARKRVQEHQAEVAQKRARVASSTQEKQVTFSPPTEYTSTATESDNPTASISQTAAAFFFGSNDHAMPGNSIDSASSPKPHASSGYRPIGGTMSTSSIKKLEGLTYYTELDARGNGKDRSFSDMDLDQLRDLAAQEEDIDGDIQQRNSAGHVYYFIFLKTGAIKDLERTISRAGRQIPTKIDNPNYAPRLKNLIVMLVKKYEHTNSLDDLQEAIFRAQEMIAATPPDHPDRPGRISDWINMMFKKCSRTGSQDDLNEAMMAAREVGAVISANDSDRRGPFPRVVIPIPGEVLTPDLNHAVKFAETPAVELEMKLFNIEAQMVSSLHDISDEDLRSFVELNEDPTNDEQIELYIFTCFMIFTRMHLMEYLKQAIQRTEGWIEVTATDHPDRARRFQILDMMLAWMNQLRHFLEDAISQTVFDKTVLLENYERTGSVNDLNEAISMMEQAVEAIPQGHPGRTGMLNNLGCYLGRRFERTGSVNDLSRAVEVANIAVEATPQDHPNRAVPLNTLGNLLGTRFWQTGSMDDLNRAIEVIDMAVEATPQGHPGQARCLHNLGNWLGKRFGRTGSMDDLNRAVEVANKAVEATPQAHPDRAGMLNNLGSCLGRRFERTGSMDDLNRAVEVADIAVEATPQDHYSRAGLLNDLGILLDKRFERTGLMDDLNRAIEVADMAMEATPQDHPGRAGCLNSLGNLLSSRFGRTRSMDDLNRAVEVVDMAVEAIPQDHPNRAGLLNTVGNLLGKRFERTGLMDDLNRAVEVTDMAVEATPQGDPNRAGFLSNLAYLFGTRFRRTGLIDDLNRAIEVADIAVKATPQDDPGRARSLKLLGNLLSSRFEWTGSMDDLKRALSSHREGWNCHNAAPSIRIRLARDAAGILASQSNWEESSMLLQEAVRLLRIVSPRSLKHTDKQHMLADFAGLASMAAATALKAGKEAYNALQLLELGRGIIADLLLEIRTDLSDLKQQHPSLADEFISIRNELDSPADRTTFPTPSNDTPSWELRAKRRREADQNFDQLLIRIRAQPGFHNFLLPPTASELMAAADADPIIIVNVSSLRCDAFLIERYQIRVLELPNLTLKELQGRARELRLSRFTGSFYITPLLEWLWDVVTRPCLEALGFKNPILDDAWPRVWWIPTGLLTQLPLHAAGRHTQGSKETVLDRVMSSYASSVKALIHGHQHHVRKLAGPPSDYALLVAMRETPGLSANQALPFAADEVKMLNDLCPSLQLKPIKPTLRKDNVLKDLQGCRIFHFAGHGRLDPMEPSQSCLLLEDWKTNPLTVGDLRDYRLQENPPFLGYLSACSTGVNEADELVQCFYQYLVLISDINY